MSLNPLWFFLTIGEKGTISNKKYKKFLYNNHMAFKENLVNLSINVFCFIEYAVAFLHAGPIIHPNNFRLLIGNMTHQMFDGRPMSSGMGALHDRQF